MKTPGAGVSRTYAMPERSDRLDFYIRDQTTRAPITEPHKHEYFQIQINLGGDTEQQIGAARRPFPTGALAFILPHRLHLIPHPEQSRFMVINFTQAFLGADTRGIADPLDLEDVPVMQAPELAPFRFQEQLDFVLHGRDLATVTGLLTRMLEVNQARAFGATAVLRGYLLQLIGLVCQQYGAALQELASRNAQRAGRKRTLIRVERHVRAQLANASLSLGSTAAAVFLSPNYLAHLVKKETGRTFVEWVTERRMAQARILLATGSQRIKDIAFMVGYHDEAYFARRFRQAAGVSPSVFRAQQAGAGA